MSSPVATAESSHPVLALLQDKSADPNHLFQALTAVEKGLPERLLCLKPILAQLGSSPSGTLGEGGRSGGSEGPSGPSEADGGDGGARAKRAVVDFLAILDVSLGLLSGIQPNGVWGMRPSEWRKGDWLQVRCGRLGKRAAGRIPDFGQRMCRAERRCQLEV